MNIYPKGITKGYKAPNSTQLLLHIAIVSSKLSTQQSPRVRAHGQGKAGKRHWPVATFYCGWVAIHVQEQGIQGASRFPALRIFQRMPCHALHGWLKLGPSSRLFCGIGSSGRPRCDQCASGESPHPRRSSPTSHRWPAFVRTYPGIRS